MHKSVFTVLNTMSYSCFPVLGDKFQIAKGWERLWHHWWKAAVKYRQEGREEMDEWRYERGMEWDRKWKAFSGFTPRDLISVIMGFMSFPSRRPHTTLHVPGHTHTSGRIFHSLAKRQTHRTCVFVSLSVPFLTLSPSTFHILHHTPGHPTKLTLA